MLPANMHYLSKIQPANSKGFTLVETLVAIGILLVSVSAVMGLINQGIVSSRLQRDRLTATYLAADAVDFIRAHRDSYWLANPDNTFNEWTNSSDIQDCRSSGSNSGCEIDTRPGIDSISKCSSECNNPLDYNSETHLYGYGNGSESKFIRSIEIERSKPSPPDWGEVKITAEVTWQNGDQTESIVLEEWLYGWFQ